MNVFDLIKQYLKNPISDEQLAVKAESIANEVGINLASIYNAENNTFDEATSRFIAEEVDKQVSSIALAVTSEATEITTPAVSGKKSKKLSTNDDKSEFPTNGQSVDESIQILIPVIKKLRSTISERTTAIKDVVRQKVIQEKSLAVTELIDLTNEIEPMIVEEFTEKLKGRAKDTKTFLKRFEEAIDEAWSN